MKNQIKKTNLEKLAAIERVKSKLFNFLSYKRRSKYELEERAVRYISQEVVLAKDKSKVLKDVLELLDDLGFVDDLVYAKQFVEEKLNSPKTISKFKIRQFLFKKHIDKTIIERALGEVSDDSQLASAVIDGKKKNYKKPKLIKYLLSRGYEYHIVYRAVDIIYDVK